MRLHSIRPHQSIQHWLLAFLVGFAMLFSTGLHTTPASAAAGSNILFTHERLQPGERLVSDGGRYHLVMQSDGNLVIYANDTPIWATNTAGRPGAWLGMQGDGNLVMYHNGVAVWDSATAGSGVWLVMQADGNLVLYTADNRALWSSGTAGIKGTTLFTHERLQPGERLVSDGGRYHLVMQSDGNLVIYANDTPIWPTNTAGRPGAWLGMQGDGNLVMYHNDVAIWATGTSGSGVRLVMQTDGNLVLYTPEGRALWCSKCGAPTNDRVALARYIRDTSRVALLTTQLSGLRDGADARSNIVDTANGGPAKRSSYRTAPGGSVYLRVSMLKGMVEVSKGYTYRVTAIAGAEHSSGSKHYYGLAFDADTINGVRVSSSNPYYKAFMNACRANGATEVLGPGNAYHSTHVHCGWSN